MTAGRAPERRASPVGAIRIMFRAITSILGALLLFAGASIVIIFGNLLDRLGGNDHATLGALDVIGGVIALGGLALAATIFFTASKAIARAWLNSSVYSALVLGCCLMVYLIAENREWRLDATRRKFYSLSPQTVNYLKNLRSRVEIAAFHVPGEGMSKRQILSYLDRYAQVCPRVTIMTCNPVTQPFVARQYAANVRPGDIFIRLLDAPTTGGARRMRRIQSLDEESLTNAIIAVTVGQQSEICLMQGHGERSPDPRSGTSRDRITALARLVKDIGFEVTEWDWQKNGAEMPDVRSAILLSAGPQTDLAAPERQAIENWLDRGGRALFLLDPVMRLGAEGNEWKRLMDRYGIELRPDLVYDAKAQASLSEEYNLRFPVPIRYGSHPIVANMPSETTAMVEARTVRGRKILSPNASVVEFLFSWNKGALEVDLRQALPEGGITKKLLQDIKPAEAPLAVAAETRRPGQTESEATKLVVFGDSDLFTDRMMSGQTVPSTLFVNALNWLSASENQIAIPPKKPEMPALILTARQERALQIGFVLLLPFAVFFGGVGYTLVRRRLG